MNELVNRLCDELNKSAEDYYNDVVVPLRKMIKVLKAEKLALQEENRKLKEVLEMKVKMPSEVYLTHIDAERYKKMLLEKNQEIAKLKNEISKIKNLPISRYSIDIKNGGKKGK